MKIVVCGSMSAHKYFDEIAETLRKQGHEVVTPSTENIAKELDSEGNSVESAQIKIENNLIIGYFHEIENCDAVLIVNVPKNGMEGYIGGNSFLEMGFAHVTGKPLYVLNQYSNKLSYYDELNALQPIVLNGNLNQIVDR